MTKGEKEMKEIDKVYEEYTKKIEAIHDELARVLTHYEMEDQPEDEPPYTLEDVYDVAVWVQNRLAELLN